MVRRLLTIALIGIGLTGCVSADKYRAAQIENEQLKQELGGAQTASSRDRAAYETLKAQTDGLMAQAEQQRQLYVRNVEENETLKAQNLLLAEKYRNAMDDKGNIIVNQTMLPPAQTAALREFAAKYPDLVEFDAAHGTIKFKSDVTFASGSSDLNANAKVAAQKFGQLLNSETFRNFEFFVAGHTDNRPVTSSLTKAAHTDNWGLSAHRAISVAKELFSQGVNPKRVGIQGFADQRPIAPNTSAAGQAKNRRVEVVIMPTTSNGGAIQSAGSVTPARTPISAPRQPVLDKDAALDTRPVLNK